MPHSKFAQSKGLSPGSLTRKARATHKVLADQVSKIICHREFDKVPQFLVCWRTNEELLVPPRAICSWHDLDELSSVLHFIQAYIENLPAPGSITACDFGITFTQNENTRKRKAPGVASHDDPSNTGLLTPLPSHMSLSRSPSVSSLDLAPEADEQSDWRSITVYNGILQKKEGRIYPKKPRFGNVSTADASKLPSDAMKEHASATPGPIAAAERLIRDAFMEKLQHVPGVYLQNEVDNTTPSLDFKFIDKFVLREGVYAAGPETNPGCHYPCRPNMAHDCGCEYTRDCGCLEFAAVDEARLAATDPARHVQYQKDKLASGFTNTEGLPKRFPYSMPKKGTVQTLNPFYRESRYPIYECNDNCDCGPNCKTRLVNKGRHVDLTIFKTANRGWGVCCNENLLQGEFIDVYLGEVLTNEETTRREEKSDVEKGSYLYSLDKFVGDDPDLTGQTCFVVDGQYMGNATRFINHSCEPNCRQYTVSHNKYDLRVYNLGFFAYENIPAGTELTFDYIDKDEQEEEDVQRTREEAFNDPENEDAIRCNCGASKCRGYLWA